ncbi:hypothetical protein GFY24_29475 [Nocardia sp. SYP-A9097]|uniref:hypothetical protein n=1 Tax=Nocardia sp. SYP-A9097 TaxID=2663237 RepID=UPI00129AF665|nr:hypothetical protein [Nocardia sp. SYP-A9097]MRH91523.1 hypothetical protein [Nocardia sp. SYP-A9097]
MILQKLDEDAAPGLGQHPRDARPPIVLDTSAATDLGYQAVGDYATTVTDTIDRLASSAVASSDGAWHLPPIDADFLADSFAYFTEDSYLATRL